MTKRGSIIEMMQNERVRSAVADLEAKLQQLSLTPQQQMAVLATLAVKQVSVLPISNEDACDVFVDLMAIAQSL